EGFSLPLPEGSVAVSPDCRHSIVLLARGLWGVLWLGRLDSKQFRSLGPKSAQLFIVWLVLVHPGDSAVVPGSRTHLVVQLPLDHGQEEPIRAVAASTS